MTPAPCPHRRTPHWRHRHEAEDALRNVGLLNRDGKNSPADVYPCPHCKWWTYTLRQLRGCGVVTLTHGSARLLIGDVFERMKELPDGSIDLVVSSPPFLALRSYLPADHPDKALEIGSEATPAEFLDTLLALTAEWRRLLAPHGSIAIELGDTYAGSDNSGNSHPDPKAPQRGEFRAKVNNKGPGWPLDKSLTGIPDLYAIALEYGINPLTGQPSPAGQWRVRNKIPWCRPNPPVGALGDKCRPATSYITVATIARNRWWDMEDCRTAYASPEQVRGPLCQFKDADNVDSGRKRLGEFRAADHAGAPLLDYWVIPTQPYKGAHYATFPTELPARLIKLMCPRDVCTTCQEPRRRIVAVEYADAPGGSTMSNPTNAKFASTSNKGEGLQARALRIPTTLGWSDCQHNSWRPGLVLDPFAGSGTTLAAATGLGRAAIGIDLDARNADLARQRVGLFLDVVESGDSARWHMEWINEETKRRMDAS